MGWPNDSVIILDSPRKHGGRLGKKTIKPKKRRSINKLTRQRQRSPCSLRQSRSPRESKKRILGMVYNKISHRSIPRIEKQNALRPSEAPNEIVILSDDEDCQVVTDKPLECNSKSTILSETNTKARAKRRRSSLSRECKNRHKKRKLMVSGPHDENDELQVIWTSTAVPESFRNPVEDSEEEKTQERGVESDDTSDKFFIDTDGDKNLLHVDVLDAERDKETNRLEKMHKKKKEARVTGVRREKKRGLARRNKEEVLGKELREIIVDGCNVAMGYSNHNKFDVKGLEVVLDYFVKKGHSVKIFLPEHERKRNPELLNTWNKKGLLVFTPSKKIGNKKITPYDDRFILEYAYQCQGIVISSDRYRDLWNEKPHWRKIIEERVLQPTFVGDYVMFPEDPLGRGGPSLEAYLRR